MFTVFGSREELAYTITNHNPRRIRTPACQPRLFSAQKASESDRTGKIITAMGNTYNVCQFQKFAWRSHQKTQKTEKNRTETA
ncbi:hypothetical protein Y032_0554g3365 [Ancylostoma ceylanicum]|nr:hypothetical protein Y032_0554g3365 [Ancylostoma ceylanicum]